MWRVVLVVMLAGCSLYFNSEPSTAPPDAPTATLPAPELVALPFGDARDIAVDDRYVYWTEQSLDGTGSVVRSDKQSGERVDLAVTTDGMPSELELVDGYVYWTELRGYSGNGRWLGSDRVMRTPIDGGAAEIVADDQWFEDYDIATMAAVGDTLYWLDGAGAIRFSHVELGGVPVVETLRTGLDQPGVIGANASNVCFRTGQPNSDCPIWCAATSDGSLRSVGAGFPRSLVFEGDTLYWADEQAEVIVAAEPTGSQPVVQLGPANLVLGLQLAKQNFLWDEELDEPSPTARVRMSRPDGAIATIATVDGWLSAFASDTAYVYMIDGAHNQIVRAPRP